MDNKQRQRLLTLVAIVCVGALAGDRLLITPLTDLWKERAERIAELDKDLMKGRLLLDREDVLRTRWEQMQQSAFPQDRSLGQTQVLNSIARWIDDSRRLTISYFKPNWRNYQDEYVTLECRLVAQGNISQISRFLYELEKDPLALKLEDVEITSNDETGDNLSLAVAFSGLQFIKAVQ